MRHLWSLLVVIATAHVVQAADWPQWLGPRRDGSSTEKVAPWGSDLKVLWKQPVGEGHSSPVVAGGKVYLFTKKRDNNDEVIQAFDAATGEPLWSKAYNRGPFKSLFGNGPRGTPAVAGGKIYTFGITGILSCLDANNGERLWQVDTLKEYDAKNLFADHRGRPGRGQRRRPGRFPRRLQQGHSRRSLEVPGRPGQLLVADRHRRGG
jgi:outer membrane protein assembly factor BamB